MCRTGSSGPRTNKSLGGFIANAGSVAHLWNDGNSLSQVCQTNFRDVESIYADCTFRRFDEAEETQGQRRFAAAWRM